MLNQFKKYSLHSRNGNIFLNISIKSYFRPTFASSTDNILTLIITTATTTKHIKAWETINSATDVFILITSTCHCTPLAILPTCHDNCVYHVVSDMLCYVNIYHKNFVLVNVSVLHCIALHCIALHCIALHCIALHCIALHCIALHCIALHCIALHCIALHCIALHCIALHCIALHCMFSVSYYNKFSKYRTVV